MDFLRKLGIFWFTLHYCTNRVFLANIWRLFFTLHHRWSLPFLANTLEFLELHFTTARKWISYQRPKKFAVYHASLLKSWFFDKSLVIPQLRRITAILSDFLPQTGRFLIYFTSLLKKLRNFANILEIKYILCTTAKIIDWLTKSGSFLNQFAWLLKWWNFCQNFGISFFTSHHCSKIDLLPKSRKFLNYPASLLKNGFLAKIWKFLIRITLLLKS